MSAAIDFGRRLVIGTPVTPKGLLPSLAGSSFCVSFADPRDLDRVIELVGQDEILLLDNGAFSIWNAKRRGAKLAPRLRFDDFGDYRAAFWTWANTAQDYSPQAIAVIPDVIQGSEEENLLELSWALRGDDSLAWFPERTMSIWHMNESLDFLETQARLMNFVGFGSCSEFDVTGTTQERLAYRARLAEASEVIDQVERDHGRRPWIHLMRGLGVFPEFTRFDSADSTNIAVNHSRHKATHGDDRAAFMKRRTQGHIDAGLAEAEVEVVLSSISNFDDAPVLRPKL